MLRSTENSYVRLEKDSVSLVNSLIVMLSRNNQHLDCIIDNEILTTLLVHASLSLKDSSASLLHRDDKIGKP